MKILFYIIFIILIIYLNKTLDWTIQLHPESINYDINNIDTYLNYIIDLKLTSVKIDFNWKDIEPTQGIFDITKKNFFKNFLIKAKNKNLKTVVILAGLPEWASNLYKNDYQNFLINWKKYVQIVINDLGFSEFYQIGNEPNNMIPGVNQLYGPNSWEVIKEAGLIIKNLSPLSKRIVNIDASWPPIIKTNLWENFANELCIKSKQAIDIMAVDFYPGVWTLTTYNDYDPLNKMISKIKNVNDPCYGLKTGLMETGFTTVNFPGLFWTELGQWTFYNSALPKLKQISQDNMEVEILGLYELIDDGAPNPPVHELNADLISNAELYFGLLRKDFSKKLAYNKVKYR